MKHMKHIKHIKQFNESEINEFFGGNGDNGNAEINIEGSGDVKTLVIREIFKLLDNIAGDVKMFIDGDEINRYTGGKTGIKKQ